jgi:hypothetical protein
MVMDQATVMVVEDPFIKSLNSFISFINVNWLTILILSMIGVLCIIDIRDRRRAARLRRAACARSVERQTKNERLSSDPSYE